MSTKYSIRALAEKYVTMNHPQGMMGLFMPASKPDYTVVGGNIRRAGEPAIDAKIATEVPAATAQGDVHPAAAADTETEELAVQFKSDLVGKLLFQLTQRDAREREKAAKTLGELGDRRAVEPLIQLLDDEDW